MDQIEVYIKITPNNKVYSLPIRKSEKILKLKEYCKILSKIPQNQQDLLFKGNILLNEKLISDYDIKDNDNIILIKKEEPNLRNIPIKQNFNNLNSNENSFNINNINIPNNDEINANELADVNKRTQPQEIISFLENTDSDKLDDYFKLLGIKFSDIFEVEPQIFKTLLKDPSFKNHFNNIINMNKDPSILEMRLKHPAYKNLINNNPYMKFFFQNPQLMLALQMLQINQNMFKKDESNSVEKSNSKIPKPPEPLERLNNNLINQMKNQIPNSLNSNEIAFNLNNINFSNNNEINFNEFANACKQLDYLSFFDNVDLDKLDNFCKGVGIKFSDFCGEDIQELKKYLKDPSFRNEMIKIMNYIKDPSFLEMFLKNPIYQNIIKNNPFIKLSLNNPQLMPNPQNFQILQNMLKKNESNPVENSISKNLVPPDPFGSLNNSQINQLMKPSDLIQNFNSINNNSNEIGIDYKEKYKEELSKLKDIGFTNEEANIQALKKFNGSIENSINMLLEQNN